MNGFERFKACTEFGHLCSKKNCCLHWVSIINVQYLLAVKSAHVFAPYSNNIMLRHVHVRALSIVLLQSLSNSRAPLVVVVVAIITFPLSDTCVARTFVGLKILKS